MSPAVRRADPRPVLICWLATRGLLLGVAVWLMRTGDRALAQVLSNWDVAHFTNIATAGYVDPLEITFFPGLPLLMRGLAAVGIDMVVGAAIAAQLASGLAAWALHRIGGTWLACAWLLAPMTVFTAVPYTEAFFCAAAFWAWERGLAGRWGQVGLLAALACAFRISGLFLVAALGIMALVQVGRHFADRLRDAAWLALPAAVLGGYAFYLYVQTGSWTAWYTAQGAGWQRNLSWPWEALEATLPLTAESYWPGRPEVPIMFRLEIVSVVIGYATALVCLLRRRWAEFTWVFINVVALSSSGWFMSVNRAVLLWFPFFALVAAAATWRPRDAGRRAAWHVLVGILLAVDVAVLVWWAVLFGTGAWAS